MRAYGFSTGALAKGDVQRGVACQADHGVTAVEVSALREFELEPTLTALPGIDFSAFSYVSVHAPSRRQQLSEEELVARLEEFPDHWSIVVHPNTIEDYDVWAAIEDRICIENMDQRKYGRTADELDSVFANLKRAGFCLDLGHAHQVDPTMGVAIELLERYGDALRHVHISEVNSHGQHVPMSFASQYAFSSIAHLLPSDVPVIIESVVGASAVASELATTRAAVDSASLRKVS